ncbi:MAG: tyrosine-type recombinase/integrase [Parabacteroides sp.]
MKLATHYVGIRKTLTSQNLRHTFATIAINNGVPVEVVSRILGHTNIKTTQIYAKVLSESVRRGFDKLSGLL